MNGSPYKSNYRPFKKTGGREEYNPTVEEIKQTARRIGACPPMADCMECKLCEKASRNQVIHIRLKTVKALSQYSMPEKREYPKITRHTPQRLGITMNARIQKMVDADEQILDDEKEDLEEEMTGIDEGEILQEGEMEEIEENIVRQTKTQMTEDEAKLIDERMKNAKEQDPNSINSRMKNALEKVRNTPKPPPEPEPAPIAKTEIKQDFQTYGLLTTQQTEIEKAINTLQTDLQETKEKQKQIIEKYS